jgi:putative tryptophan/tyrosine transport system substrate-binding protein
VAIGRGGSAAPGGRGHAGYVRNAAEIEYAITSFAQKENGGLVVLPHALSVFNASTIIALAQRYRLPDIHAVAEAVAAGGLVSYGINWDGQFRSAAEYVDRILKGTKPADLPVQQPTKFDLVINLKSARTIGLEIPPANLLRADEVIE